MSEDQTAVTVRKTRSIGMTGTVGLSILPDDGSALSHRDPTLYGEAQKPRNERDFYATPAWVTRALLSKVRRRLAKFRWACVWEPACGDGAISKVLKEDNLISVRSSDIETEFGFTGIDFLKKEKAPQGCKVIITNPPYDYPGQRNGRLACDFIEHALELMEPVGGQVYMLLPAEFDFAPGRHRLFRDCRAFYEKHTITKRIMWIEGTEDKGRKHHAWYVWDFVRGDYNDAHQRYLTGVDGGFKK